MSLPCWTPGLLCIGHWASWGQRFRIFCSSSEHLFCKVCLFDKLSNWKNEMGYSIPIIECKPSVYSSYFSLSSYYVGGKICIPFLVPKKFIDTSGRSPTNEPSPSSGCYLLIQLINNTLKILYPANI